MRYPALDSSLLARSKATSLVAEQNRSVPGVGMQLVVLGLPGILCIRSIYAIATC